MAGNGTSGNWASGSQATSTPLNAPTGLAVDPNGSVYFADPNAYAVALVAPNGQIFTAAGTVGSPGNTGDGGRATSAQMSAPYAVAVAPDGSLLIADYGCCVYSPRVRAVDTDGTIRTIAGKGSTLASCSGSPLTCSGDNGPSQNAAPWQANGIAVDGGGEIFVSDNGNGVVRKMTPYYHWWNGTFSSQYVPSDRGDEIYVFDAHGRHTQTLDALNGNIVKYQLTYDANTHLLTQVKDVYGNTTTINRPDATHVNIVSPYNQTTALVLDANGYISSITNPNSEVWSLTHDSTGLLTTLKDPNDASDPGNHTHTFQYDSLGYLIKDTDPLSNAKTMSRATGQQGDYTVTFTTPLGRATTYAVSRESPDKGGEVRTVTEPDGYQKTRDHAVGDNYTTTLYGGDMTETLQLAGDPRFGMAMPYTSSRVTTINGSTMTTTRSRSTVFTQSNILVPTSQTDTITVNGQSTTIAFNAATSTLLRTSPVGRQVQTTLDSKWRASQVAFPNTTLSSISFAYDDSNNGRLSSVTQGSRTTTFGYYVSSTGFVKQVTDPSSATTTYARDSAGRATQITLPDGSTSIALGYDKNGNSTSVTPPSSNVHSMTYTGVDLLSQYQPPLGSTYKTTYAYDADRFLTSAVPPGGNSLTYTPDTYGRLSSIFDSSSTNFGTTYDLYGRVTTQTTGDGTTVTYAYRGPLLSSAVWSGTTAGTVAYTYDNNFRISTTAVATGATMTYAYDNDGLLSSITESTNGKTLAFTRDGSGAQGATGLVSSATIGVLSETYAYDTYGALTDYSVTCSSCTPTNVYTLHYDRDSLGRVTKKTETITNGSATSVYYQYDTLQRLWKACTNDSTCAIPANDNVYGYDSDGNRTSRNGIVGTYDAQDRIVTYNGTNYTYNANGALTSTSAGASYSYDLLGNLRSATPPSGGTAATYVIDGASRRVAKKYNSTTQAFLYGQGLAPVAELTGASTVYSTFGLGRFTNVPELMVVKGGSTYRLVLDQLGSVRLVVDVVTGAVAQQINYDEWGSATLVSDSRSTSPPYVLSQPFGFAGGLYDKYTGLVRFGARDYDASTGRWTSRDPITFQGGQSNLYVYSQDDPLNRSDASGEGPREWCFALCGVALAVCLASGAPIGDCYQVFFLCTGHCPAPEPGPPNSTPCPPEIPFHVPLP